MIRWHWYTGRGFAVTYHLLKDMRVIWTDIYGLQIGLTFFGIVRSRNIEEGESDPRS